MSLRNQCLFICLISTVVCHLSDASAQSSANPASSDAGTGVDLTVQITDVTSSSGKIRVSVFAGADGFPRDVHKAITSIKLDPSQPSHTFKGLPAGVYAVTVLHDLNSNGEVDTNFIGMPKEPIGLSRYQTIGVTNMPDFQKAAFRLDRSGLLKVKLLAL